MVMRQSDLKLIDHKFLLETCDLDTHTVNSYQQKNQIFADKAIAKFYSFKDMQNFITANPDILNLKNSGFAAYISYERKIEIVLYEEIHKKQYENLLIKNQKETSHSKLNTIDLLNTELFNKTRFINNVCKCQKFIEEGDIYQVNISEKVIISKEKLSYQDLKNLYKDLKNSNPSPYMSFIDFENYSIISSSPESFLKFTFENNELTVKSSPIKGTAKLNEENILDCSEKEKAEHMMIVDLIRNDIGKISKTASVKVIELMQKYKFKDLFHLISTVQGALNQEHILEINHARKQNEIRIPDFEKIFSYCFPGGSITGTPKQKAIELIEEIENQTRGLYTGSAGYYKFHEGGEFNILIRTLVYDKNNQELSLHSGAGITADSNPEKEFEEIELKSKNIITTLKKNNISNESLSDKGIYNT